MGRNKKDFQGGKEQPAPQPPKTQDEAWALLKPFERAAILERQKKAAIDPKIVRTQPWERQSPREKPPSRPKKTPKQKGRPTPEKFQEPRPRVDDGR